MPCNVGTETDLPQQTIGDIYCSAGCLETAIYTDHGSGSITIDSLDVLLFNNPIFTGSPVKYTVAGITETMTDQTMNYIVADYNAGNPILRVITDVELITESDIIPILSVFRDGAYPLEIQDWDSLGKGLSNKLHQSIVKTQRYRRASGLGLSEYGTRNVNCSAGVVWVGAVKYDLEAIASSIDNILYFARSGGAWSLSAVQQYNNTQYSDGTNTHTLTNDRYAVNWLYRGVEDFKHLYMVLGSGDYKIDEALLSQPPSNLPPKITSHAMLIGRIIVQKSASSALYIQSAFDLAFSSAGVTVHNELSGLQGGTSSQYYHMTSGQHGALGALGSLTSGAVLYAGSGGVIANKPEELFFAWDTNRFGIGTNSPTVKFQIGNNSEQITQKIYCGGANKAPVFSFFNAGSAEGVVFQTQSRFGMAMTGGVANYQDATLEATGGVFLDSNNRVMFGASTNPLGRRVTIAGGTDEIKLAVRGASAQQSYFLQTWENSSTGAVAHMTSAGNFRAQGISFGSRFISNTDQGVIDTDYLILASANGTSFILTLPLAGQNSGGRCLVIKRVDSNKLTTITVKGNGVEAIDGSNTITLNFQYQCVTLISDAIQWHIA